jgi:hypothetical protein
MFSKKNSKTKAERKHEFAEQKKEIHRIVHTGGSTCFYRIGGVEAWKDIMLRITEHNTEVKMNEDTDTHHDYHLYLLENKLNYMYFENTDMMNTTGPIAKRRVKTAKIIVAMQEQQEDPTHDMTAANKKHKKYVKIPIDDLIYVAKTPQKKSTQHNRSGGTDLHHTHTRNN